LQAGAGGFSHLIDPRRTWYNNRRLIALNGWIVLLYVRATLSSPRRLMATMGV
ncbi:hypothetical protein BDZ89DRAFT_1074937, partial [Hymenopellis radicata]